MPQWPLLSVSGTDGARAVRGGHVEQRDGARGGLRQVVRTRALLLGGVDQRERTNAKLQRDSHVEPVSTKWKVHRYERWGRN